MTDCSKALIQDLVSYTLDKSSALHYLNIVDEEIYNKAKSKGGFEVDFKIKGIPFGADSDYSDFAEWRKKYFQETNFSQNSELSAGYLSKKVSVEGYKSYDNCINQTSKAAGLFIKVVDSDKKYVTIEIFYKISTGSSLNRIKVHSSDLKNGKISGVADGKLFNVDESINPNQSITLIIAREIESEAVHGAVNAGDFSQSFRVNGYSPPIPPPICKQNPIIIEASSFIKGESKNICDNCHGYGSDIITNNNRSRQENKATYKFDAVCSGNYKIEVYYTAKESRPIEILVNNETINNSACGSITGGWASPNLRWEEQGICKIVKGDNKLVLFRNNVFPHIRQIKLTQME